MEEEASVAAGVGGGLGGGGGGRGRRGGGEAEEGKGAEGREEAGKGGGRGGGGRGRSYADVGALQLFVVAKAIEAFHANKEPGITVSGTLFLGKKASPSPGIAAFHVPGRDQAAKESKVVAVASRALHLNEAMSSGSRGKR